MIPLARPTVLPAVITIVTSLIFVFIFERFWKMGTDGRTGTMCEYCDHHRLYLGRPRGSISYQSRNSFPSKLVSDKIIRSICVFMEDYGFHTASFFLLSLCSFPSRKTEAHSTYIFVHYTRMFIYYLYINITYTDLCKNNFLLKWIDFL